MKKVIKTNILFWAVDCQKDFMDKGGALYIEGAETIKPTLQKLTDLAKLHDIRVINTADWHESTDSELSDNPDFKTTFPPHCMKGTEGAEFIEETRPIEDKEIAPLLFLRDVILRKNKFNIFEGNDMVKGLLTELRPNTIIVYGVAADVCVDFAAKGLRERGYKVIVVADAIKELPTSDINAVIENWKKVGIGITDYKALEIYVKMVYENK